MKLRSVLGLAAFAAIAATTLPALAEDAAKPAAQADAAAAAPADTAAAAPAQAAGDATLGKKVFNKCKACHDVTGKNKIGPHLDGIIGRKAGSVEDFQAKYSDVMKAKGAGDDGLKWDETTLAEYMKDPKGYVPGNKMAFAGLKKDDDIANLIAYLKADPKP